MKRTRAPRFSRRGVALSGLLVLLALLVAQGLRPSVQRELVLALLAPHVEAIELGEVRILPWSLRVAPARLSFAGIDLRLRELEARFNPLALLGDTVAVSRLSGRGVSLDLSAMPAAAEDPPFAGLLAVLDRGFALELETLDLEGSVHLPSGQRIELTATAHDIRPHLAGQIPLELKVEGGGASPGLAARGVLSIAQLARGRLRALGLELTGDYTLPGHPTAERFEATFSARPPRGMPANLMARTRLVEGKEVRIPAPESWQLEVVLPSTAGGQRARLALDAEYHGEDGQLAASGRLHITDALLRPWLDVDLPAFETTFNGRATLQLPTGDARFSLGQDTQVSLPAPWPALQFESSVAGQATATSVLLERVTLQTTAAGVSAPLLAGALGTPLDIPWDEPLRLLATPRALAAITLGPLPLGPLAPVPTRLSGTLAGQFEVGVDDKARLYLRASSPLRWDSPQFSEGDATLLEGTALEAAPLARWSPARLHLALGNVNLTALPTTPGAPLQFDVALSRPLDRTDAAWRARISGSAGVAALLAQPGLAALGFTHTLPADLGVRFAAEASLGPRGARLERLDLNLGQRAETPQLALALAQPWVLQDARGRWVAQANPMHPWPAGWEISARAQQLPLAWANAWLAPASAAIALDGLVQEASAQIAANRAGEIRVEADAPWRLSGLGLRQEGKAVLRDLALALKPALVMAGSTVSASLDEIDLHAGGTALFSGRLAGEGRLPAAKAGSTLPARMEVSGALDIGAALRQPGAARSLPPTLRGLPLRAELDLSARGSPAELEFARAEVTLYPGERSRLTLAAAPGLIFRPHLGAGEALARHLEGEVTLRIDDLTSTTVARVLPLGATRFDDLSADLRLRSDGRRLTATSLAPLVLSDVRLGADGKAPVQPFELSGRFDLSLSARTLRAAVDDLALQFSGAGSPPALRGRGALSWVPEARVPLRTLELALEAALPQWLSQPAALPGHHLQGGTLALTATVDASRKLAGQLVLADLASRKPLPIRALQLPLTGSLAADGRGFDFSAPVIAAGRSGATRATLRGHYAPQPDEPRVITLGLASEILYLNDWLAAWRRVQPDAVAVTAPTAQPARRRRDATPDTRAAWKLIPPALVVDLAIDALFYTDYLAFHDITGTLDLRSRRMGLKNFEAHFHDSRIALDGRTRFTAGAIEPYALELVGEVTDFNLNEFLSELVPGQKPRMEGLFSGRLKAHGEFPNLAEARNHVLFDLKLQSREGLFRPLPPDSGLLIGASEFLGVVGEGLSYLPTGGFGAGAVARLVNYIAEIDYDTIDIHLARRGPEGVRLAAFEMLSPTIAMMASGDITQTPGVDLLDSPLELTAELDMLGKGAAILYSLNLLRDTRSGTGYWQGPRFKVWGTLSEPHSNLEDIINTAGDAAVQGAWTRPLSGLLGNVKFRWRDDNARTREAAREQRAARARARDVEPPP